MSTTKFAGITALTEFLSKCDDRYARAGNIPGVDSYTITKLATATAGYAATYQLNKNGAAIAGSVIDIPKDYLVKSATLNTCSTANNPVQGYTVGDKYIDFVVNTANNDGTDSHIYLLVSDLVDAAGNGINITSQNVVSVKLGTANGLSLDNNGLSLSTATTSAAGAMSAADKVTLGKAYTTDNMSEITSAEVDALFN